MAKHITTAKKEDDFSPHAFLSTIGKGRDMVSFPKKDAIFAQVSVVLNDDNGTSVVPEAGNPSVRVKKALEPPATPGSPPDNESAKKPRLRSPERRRK